jgi:hypothetical protein
MEDGQITEIDLLPSFLDKVELAPKQRATIQAKIKAPLKKGKYKLFFSLRTEPFPGTRNSGLITFNVD